MKHAMVLNLLAYRYKLLAIVAVLIAFKVLTNTIGHPLAISPLAAGLAASNESSATQVEVKDLSPGTIGIVALVERPIFNRTRRPYVRPPPEPAPNPEAQTQQEVIVLEPQLTLQGIFIRGSIRRALVLTSESPMPTWLQEGDNITAWRLAEIKPNQLILQAGDQRRAVELYVEKP